MTWILLPCISGKVVLLSGFDISPLDSHMLIAIRSTLLMPKTGSVQHFVNDSSRFEAAPAQGQNLSTAHSAHPAVAAAVGQKVDVVGVLGPLGPPPHTAEL